MATVEEFIVQTNRQLMAAIESQPDAMTAVLTHVRGQMQSTSLRQMLQQAGSIFLTGCGDSLFAGMASQQAFLQYGGVMTQPVEALEYSRYLGLYVPPDSLLIAVSNSGRVARTVEAARMGTRYGGTIAITNAPDSLLARSATQSIAVGLPPMSSGATGTRSYLASMLALYVIAITLGEVRGTLSAAEAADLHRVLDEGVEAVAWTVHHSQVPIKSMLLPLQSRRVLYIIGAGPNYGTAHYGAAKFLEALGLSGVPVQMEEWAHLQFHLAGPDTTFILLAPADASRQRALEQLRGLNDMQADVIVIGPAGDSALPSLSSTIVPVSGRLPAIFSPLEMAVPLQWMAALLAESRGTTMHMLIDEHHRDVNFRQIFDSGIVQLPTHRG